MPDEEENFRGFLILDLTTWYDLYTLYISNTKDSFFAKVQKRLNYGT